MSDPVPSESVGTETTGTFQYQELIESRLGQPIAAFMSDEESARIARSPGAKLVAGRIAMGWSVEYVASQLRLAPRQILALESDDYAHLPEAAIVRGFIRSYAKLLKLDAAPLVALLSTDTFGTNKASSATLTSSEAGKSRATMPFKIIIVGIGMLALVWFFLRR